MENNNMISIHPNLVENLENAPCDLYIRLEKNNKNILIAKKDEQIPEVMSKISQQNMMLFLNLADSNMLQDKTLNVLMKQVELDVGSNEKVQKHMQLFSNMHEYSMKLFKTNYGPQYNNESILKMKDLIFEYVKNSKILENSRLASGVLEMPLNNSLEVMILSMVVGHKLGLPDSNISMLNTSAFFCDVGLLVDPKDIAGHISRSALMTKIILNKSNYQMIVNQGDAYLGILHHHEYEDGSGAFQATSSKIHIFGKIIRTVEDFLKDKDNFFNLHDEKVRKHNPEVWMTLKSIMNK